MEALKGGFGLKDAPRLWKLRLHTFFESRGYLRSHFDECTFHLYSRAMREAYKTLTAETAKKTAKTARKGLADLSKAKAEISVNTHVDDIEALVEPSQLPGLHSSLEGEFGPCKVQKGTWKHVGSEYTQSQNREELQVRNTSFAKALRFYPVPRERRSASGSSLDTTEHGNFRSSVGGSSWFIRWRLDLVSKLQALQSKLQTPTVLDLIHANALTRIIQESAQQPLVYRALPRGTPLRLLLFVDAGKGDYTKAEKYPILAHILCLAPDREDTLDGPVQLADWRGKKSTRVGKSSLHVEALAMAGGIERGETLLGVLEEFYVRTPHLRTLLELQEAGAYAVPMDVITDSKSLFDLVTGVGEPKPSDEGSLLWLRWIRERVQRGSVRHMIWACTQDQLSDPLTKDGVDLEMLHRVMRTGVLKLRYAFLCKGKLRDAHKGLPPPKSQRDGAAQAFCEAFHNADQALAAFHGVI
jgi:hypothetical protein